MEDCIQPQSGPRVSGVQLTGDQHHWVSRKLVKNGLLGVIVLEDVVKVFVKDIGVFGDLWR